MVKRVAFLILLLISSVSAVEKKKTVKSIGGDYSTLEACLNANETDLTAGVGTTFVASIEDPWIGADNSAVLVDGWIPSRSYFITIETDAGARHDGKWNVTDYRLVVNGRPFRCFEPFTEVYGLQVNHTYDGVNPRDAVFFNTLADSCVFAYNIVKSTGTAANTQYALYMQGAGTLVYNNIVYGFNDEAGDRALFANPMGGEQILFFNNTIVDCRTGMFDNTERINAQNNLFKGCYARANAIDFQRDTDYNTTDSSSFEYTHATTEDSVDAPITFAGADDFHLASQQHDNGFDLSAHFTDDIDGDTRSNWNRGADEFVGAEAADISYTRRIKIIKGE